MTLQIITSKPTPEIEKEILEEFIQHSIETIGFDGFQKDYTSFEIRDDKKEIVGICTVKLFFGNLHIKVLIIKKKYRGQGFGTQLINHALQYAKEQGCSFAFIESMSFQAPEFYKKLGFEIELKRDGYAGGTSFYYLRKDL
jgi:ribosomal protein S18 acetylase RimI-like enzyme